MRIRYVAVCVLLVVCLLCACTGKSSELVDPVNFYYCNQDFSYNSPASVIQAEVREGTHFHGSTTALLQEYLKGPVSNDLQLIIPQDVSLVSCEVSGGSARVVMSVQFSKLAGVKLSASCSALLMTMHEFAEVDSLVICVAEGQLDGKNEITMSIDDIVLLDTAAAE